MARHFVPLTPDEFKIKLAEAILKTPNSKYDDQCGTDLEGFLTDYTGDPIPYPISAADLSVHNGFFSLVENWLIINSPKITSDLSKIKFDWENYEIHEKGFRSLSGDLQILVFKAGGDWEIPVYMIMYWDGKEIRGYIPEDGNTFKASTRMAYGNDEDDDTVKLPHKPDDNKFYTDIMNRIQPKP